jgi:tryptophan synthase alpha chain
MNSQNIKRAFNNNKAFIAFITAGDPNIETTEKLIPAMEKAGADLIEIGIPFSDPVAEGIVIQNANERALKLGITTDKIFEMVKRVHVSIKIPLVFLTYINPVFTYGAEKFFKRCQECGIEGIIIPDLPYEEKAEIEDECNKNGVEIISLIAPTSEERIEKIARNSQGFIYLVSSLGVTGVRSTLTTDISQIAQKVKEYTDTPCAVGFGISKPQQAEEMVQIADGAIVGSAIVKIIEEFGENCVNPVCQYVSEMKAACIN